MRNEAEFLTLDMVRTIIEAQEIIYMRRMVALMQNFLERRPTSSPLSGDTIPLKLVQTELARLKELELLRAHYVKRAHVDPEDAKVVAKICRENAALAEARIRGFAPA